MNQKEKESARLQELEAVAAMSELPMPAARVPMRSLNGKSPWMDRESVKCLEKTRESLVLAYLAANLNRMNIPLKAFLDGFEKNILLACLRLTRGSQKNAAAMLCLKPTALFEKMRKHGIRSQRGRLSGETWAPPAGGTRHSFLTESGGNHKHASGMQ